MRYKILLIILLFYSCAINTTKLENRAPYTSKGFAYIYNDEDYKKKNN